jgi:hypothetical protein
MRAFLTAGWILMAVAAASAAEVINVEFKFTPFVGDPVKNETVQTVAGTAKIFLNGVPYAEQEVGESEAPVLFEEREIGAAVWLPAESCGPALRRGRNVLRLEFAPADPKAAYKAQLRWASVMDEAAETSEGGTFSSTNQAGEGVEEKEATGAIAFEREFQADFAADLPWHHYPPVASLDDADRKALAGIVTRRVAAFQPDFAEFYRLLEGRQDLDLAAARNARCLETAWAVGARIAAPAEDAIELLATGGPEVVIRAREGMLFFPADMSAFERITDEEVQMCVGMLLAAAYPPRLVVVRSPEGSWEIVY